MPTATPTDSNYLDLRLPPGWIEAPQGEGPKTYWAGENGANGALEVIRFSDGDFEFIAKQEDLGVVCAELGRRIGKDSNFGEHAGNQQGTCASGRYGFAVFFGGEHPATFVWATVSQQAALLWIFRGPTLLSDEIKQAAEIVFGAQF